MEDVARRDVMFFYRHAGWSYNPATETARAGRLRGARELAAAELWARDNGIRFDWSPDWEIGSHVAEFDAYDQEPQTCETCAAFAPDGETCVASLSCIDDADWTYRRVIEAELAEEAMAPHQPRNGSRLSCRHHGVAAMV